MMRKHAEVETAERTLGYTRKALAIVEAMKPPAHGGTEHKESSDE